MGEAADQNRAGADGGDDAPGGEFEFTRGADDDDAQAGGLQTLGAATDEQAAAAAAAARSEHAGLEAGEPEGGAGGDDAGMPDAPPEDALDAGAEATAAAAAQAAAEAAESAQARQRRGATSQREHTGALTADLPADAAAPPASDKPDVADADAEEDADDELGAPAGARGDAALVALRLQQTSLADGGGASAEEDAAPALSEQQLAALREEAEASLNAWRDAAASGGDTDAGRAAALWARFEALTAPLASELCEQLRLILEPPLAARMQGDYRTGKRLNMRKIIPYLASDFRRDKIWLRRSKPSVRRYQARAPRPSRLGLALGCLRAACADQIARMNETVQSLS